MAGSHLSSFISLYTCLHLYVADADKVCFHHKFNVLQYVTFKSPRQVQYNGGVEIAGMCLLLNHAKRFKK